MMGPYLLEGQISGTHQPFEFLPANKRFHAGIGIGQYSKPFTSEPRVVSDYKIICYLKPVRVRNGYTPPFNKTICFNLNYSFADFLGFSANFFSFHSE